MDRITRRRALQAAPALAGIGALAPPLHAAERPATPACTEEHHASAAAGSPNFMEGSPRRTSLVEPGMEGQRVTLAGRVLTTFCQPLSNARVDFWQANSSGAYDLTPHFALRGHQFTDLDGRFRLETIVPGDYGMPPHVHVWVRPQGGPALMTWILFPGRWATVPPAELPEARRLLPTFTDENGVRLGVIDIYLKMT